MRILMASNYFGSHNGGVEIVAEELFREIAARDQEIVWMAGGATAAPEAGRRSCAVSLPVLNFVEAKTGLPFPIPTPGSLAQIWSQVKTANVVFVHDCLYLTNIAAFLFASFRGVPVVVIQHIGSVPYKNPLVSAFFRIGNAIITKPMLARAQQVIFISETTREHFRAARFRHPPEVIFNGVDASLHRLPENASVKTALRERFGLPTGGPVILFVGRFVEKKGLSILKRMCVMRPGYTWAFAGWGPLDPRGWGAPSVRVLSGLRGFSIAELYRACDLLVLPSTGEGFPLVVQEALASGLAVVCGAETLAADPELQAFASGVPVRLEDEERTAEEFVAAIDDCLNSEAPGKGEERRAFATARYSWREAAERYLAIASRLVPDVSSRAPVMHTGNREVLR